jgi:Mg2+ and Co2+ transporter CorA
MYDRREVRKRLGYTKRALNEHKETILKIALIYREAEASNPEYSKIVDALMTLAQTLDLAQDLVDKILELI